MKIAMVLHNRIILMRFYFIFLFIFTYLRCIYAERRNNNSSIKSIIVQEIMKKVSNITLNSLSKTPPEKKEAILNKIEKKISKFGEAIGPDANKYVKFIMDDVKTKALEMEKKNVPEVIRKSIILRTDENVTAPSTIDAETKQEIIKHIENKIQTLAQEYMTNVKTVEERKEIFEKIKKKIIDSTNQKHTQLHNKHDELKAYSSLIAEGLDVSMQKMLQDDMLGRRMDSIGETETASKGHTIEEIKKRNDTMDVEENMMEQPLVAMSMDEIQKYANIVSKSLTETTVGPHCDKLVAKTCANIQSFSKIGCGEGKTIPIENLCNGVIDCMNQVDEVNCTAQAIEKVRIATSVMSEMQETINSECFAKSMNNDILASQNQIMRDVLDTQMNFLENTVKKPLKATENRSQIHDELIIKKTLRDVTMILSTLSYALDGTICAHLINPKHSDNTASFNAISSISVDLDDFDNVPEPTWSPKSCTCKGNYCKDVDCVAPCKRICWQRYSLSHWGCQAVSGGSSVSLNVICDGKLDCFDETDESSCATDASYSKVEALKRYNNLLDLLSTKARSNDFVEVRNKLFAMHRLVHALQKQTIQTNKNDKDVIKNLRAEFFEVLVSIYEDLLHTVGLRELEDRYTILLSINEKLVKALQLSFTGNDDVLSTGGCYCRGGHCALRRCTKNCIRACLAEPLITRYSCDTQNRTVSIESVCNKKKDCPNGEDEKDCAKDICRGFHLLMLRRDIQHVRVKHKNSVTGEAIDIWKSKMSAALSNADKIERPNHTKIVEIVSRALQHLVTSFAEMEEYRKVHSDYTLQEYIGISKIVKQTLKSCRN